MKLGRFHQTIIPPSGKLGRGLPVWKVKINIFGYKAFLDVRRDKIIDLLGYGVPKKRIAELVGTSRVNLHNYIKTRKLELASRK